MRRFLVMLSLILLGVGLYLWSRPTVKVPQKKPFSESLSQPSSSRKIPTNRRVLAQDAMPSGTIEYQDDPVGTLTLDGTVIDDEGNAVPGARVGLRSNPPRQATADEAGRFSFGALSARSYYLVASRGELYGETLALVNEEELPVTIRVSLGKTVEVTVLDEIDHKPIENAEVSSGDWMPQLATTNAAGKALIRGLGPWSSLYVTAEGYQPQNPSAQANGAPGSIGQQTVLLVPGAMVSGVVLDPQGNPLSEARVFAESDLSWGLFQDDPHKIETDAQGRWSIPALSAGTYRFSARHRRFAEGVSEQVILDGKASKDGVTIRMEPAGILTGKVIDRRGEGVSGANVWALIDDPDKRGRPRSVFTDDRGAFQVEGLPLAQLKVGASSTKGQHATPAKVDLSQGSAEVTLTIDVDGVIMGLVVDQDGKPITEAAVNAMPATLFTERDKWAMLFPAPTLTDADGRFALQGMVEGAEYRLSADFPKMTQGGNRADLVMAKTGDTNVKIVLKTLGAIKGRVQFEDGSAPKTFSIYAFTSESSTFTDTNGVFEISEAPPGKLIMQVYGPDFIDKRSQQFEVMPGETVDVGTIVVSRGRVVRGVVLSEGKPVSNATVAVAAFLGGTGGKLDAEEEYNKKERTLTQEDGSFEFKGLDKDQNLSALAEHPTLGRSQTVQIPKGDTEVTLELTLSPGGIMEGRLSYAGKPVEATIAAYPMGTRTQFATNSGQDGKYRFDLLAPGVYEVAAFYIVESKFSGQQPSKKTVSVTIEANKTKKLDIDIPEGINVTVNPTRNGVTAGDTGIYIVAQAITAKNSEELTRIIDGLLKALYWNGSTRVRMPGAAAKPVTFADLPVGSYTICVVQNASTEEYFAMTDEERKAPRPVWCQPQEIGASPKELSVVIELAP